MNIAEQLRILNCMSYTQWLALTGFNDNGGYAAEKWEKWRADMAGALMNYDDAIIERLEGYCSLVHCGMKPSEINIFRSA